MFQVIPGKNVPEQLYVFMQTAAVCRTDSEEKQAWERGNGKVLSADAELGKWSELLMSLIACGVTGNVEPLFVCQPEQLNSRMCLAEEVNMSGSLKNAGSAEIV